MKNKYPILFLVLILTIFYYLSSSTQTNAENLCNDSQISITNNITENYTEKIYLPDYMYRLGPVLLKFNDEWIVEEDGNKYIFLALSSNNYSSKFETDYDLISPNFKAISKTKNTFTYKYPSRKTNELNVEVYKIPCTDTKMWIDLNIILQTRYDNDTKENNISISDAKKFFFYHPLEKKWWGVHYLFSPELITRILYSKIYNNSNTIEDIRKLLKNVSDTETKEDIINKRTLVLPPIKFYKEKYSQFKNTNIMFCWYLEKEDLEKIEPKNDDE